jgi:hypothetical protein
METYGFAIDLALAPRLDPTSTYRDRLRGSKRGSLRHKPLNAEIGRLTHGAKVLDVRAFWAAREA